MANGDQRHIDSLRKLVSSELTAQSGSLVPLPELQQQCVWLAVLEAAKTALER
jgi:hypothetical protein